MKDETFDLIPLVILLGILVSLSMKLMVPLYRDSQNLKYDVRYDKTVTASDNYLYDTTSSVGIGYSYEELILMLGKQSYFMPSPRKIDLCGKLIGIKADTVDKKNLDNLSDDLDIMYVPDDIQTTIDIKQILQDWCNKYTQNYGENGFNLQFEVRFTTGNTEDDEDDCYAVYILGKNSLGEIKRLKCLDGGKVDGLDSDIRIIYREKEGD